MTSSENNPIAVPSTLEIPHLETFCKAAELLNFTAAADELHLTQAAVSQRIKGLENDVGHELFERQAGRVYLSEAGRRLYDFAQQILALHRQARLALGQPPEEVAGDLLLAASTIPAEYLLPAILQEYQKRYPKVRVAATVGDSEAVLRLLDEGKVSLVLVGRPGPAAWSESRPFGRDRQVLLVPPSHAWARRERVTVDQVAKEPLIIREKGSGSRASFEDAIARKGRDLSGMNVILELGSNEAIKEAVLRGSGIALLSAFAVRHDVEIGRLTALDVEGLDTGRDLHLVTDRRRILPPAARAFVEVLEGMPFVRVPQPTPVRG
ncbi:MAG: selenium metabolism-associated LysR family transcriptional regulator [Gemmataceae bacterium]